MSNVKVSERRTELQNCRITELQNDRQDKNNIPPDLRPRGHKNMSVIRIRPGDAVHP